MSGRSPPLYCTLILITMRSHQSYPNITTIIYSYEYSTNVNNSTIETYRNRGLGKYQVVICTLVYCIISLIFMQGYRTNTLCHCRSVRRFFYVKQTRNMYYTANRPGSLQVPHNPLTRWDVSSIPANEIFLTKKLEN